MKLTDEKVDIINKSKIPHALTGIGTGIELYQQDNETKIAKNGMIICDLQHLDMTIRELTAIKELIEIECGVIL